MTYRDLLDQLQLMAELEPSMLNRTVMASFEDAEFFSVDNLMVEPLGNDYHDQKQPLLILGD
jgi:hypothetical protein